MFSCEMIGPSVVTRGKHGELACQYVRLEEHEKGYGCFGAQGCDGFKTRAGLRDDTMCLKAEPGAVRNETFFLSRTKLKKILSQKEMILDRAKQPSSRLSLPQLRCAPEVVRPPKCV